MKVSAYHIESSDTFVPPIDGFLKTVAILYWSADFQHLAHDWCSGCLSMSTRTSTARTMMDAPRSGSPHHSLEEALKKGEGLAPRKSGA